MVGESQVLRLAPLALARGYRAPLRWLVAPQGFSAEISSTAVIFASSALGFPLSITHVVSGGVAGSGFRQVTALELHTLGRYPRPRPGLAPDPARGGRRRGARGSGRGPTGLERSRRGGRRRRPGNFGRRRALLGGSMRPRYPGQRERTAKGVNEPVQGTRVEAASLEALGFAWGDDRFRSTRDGSIQLLIQITPGHSVP